MNEELFEKISPAVVFVRTLKYDAVQGYNRWTNSSGFLISPTGMFLCTNYAVGLDTPIEVYGEQQKKEEAEVLFTDVSTDIALCKISVPKFPVFSFNLLPKTPDIWPFLPLDDVTKLEIGQPVWAIARSSRTSTRVIEGKINSLGEDVRVIDQGKESIVCGTIGLKMTSARGVSGSPLIDAQGKLLGVMVSEKNDLAYASPIPSWVPSAVRDVESGKVQFKG